MNAIIYDDDGMQLPHADAPEVGSVADTFGEQMHLMGKIESLLSLQIEIQQRVNILEAELARLTKDQHADANF